MTEPSASNHRLLQRRILALDDNRDYVNQHAYKDRYTISSLLMVNEKESDRQRSHGRSAHFCSPKFLRGPSGLLRRYSLTYAAKALR